MRQTIYCALQSNEIGLRCNKWLQSYVGNSPPKNELTDGWTDIAITMLPPSGGGGGENKKHMHEIFNNQHKWK